MSNVTIENPNLPIGVFDSGVGGLSVVREFFRQLPGEEIVYFGDTGRYPYGPRSAERVKILAMENASFLMDFDIKMLVVACNTASSVAIELLAKRLPIPVIGVVRPGSYAAAKTTKTGKIGIIGTNATIASGSYQRVLKALNPNIQSFAKACPLFVSLAEEGWTVGPVARMVAETYLADLRGAEIDTLILGCTHYPLLRSVISDTMGATVTLIDSAESTVFQVGHILEDADGLRTDGKQPEHRFIVSDAPERFKEVGERFLEAPLPDVHKISLEEKR